MKKKTSRFIHQDHLKTDLMVFTYIHQNPFKYNKKRSSSVLFSSQIARQPHITEDCAWKSNYKLAEPQAVIVTDTITILNLSLTDVAPISSNTRPTIYIRKMMQLHYYSRSKQ
jgi:hypothetical protein